MFSPSNQEVLAAALRGARAALNWSQADLAEKAGVAIPTVARVEAALISPTLQTIGKLFKALEEGGVTFSWVNESGIHFAMQVRSINPIRRRNS